MIPNDIITLLVRETGWPLEYIRSQPVDYLQALADEISYQKAVEAYQQAYNSALIVCALINTRTRKYKPQDVIGEPPIRRNNMTKPKLAKAPKLDKITLADSKEYDLVPLDVNIMADLEDKFDKAIEELFARPMRVKVLRALLFARLQPNYPDITEEQLGKLMTDEVLLKLIT